MSESNYQPPGPTAEHAKLNPFEGTFKAVVKIWMGPGDPMESTGTMVSSWQLGNMYLHQEYTGDRIDGPFPNFCGRGYWGYNTTSNQFEGFWVDNASTNMQMEIGHVDASGKIWTMTSTVKNPQTGEDVEKRSVITLVDDDHHKMEAFFIGSDGNELKSMEIDYRRA